MDFQILRNEEVYRELVLARMLDAKRSLWIASANLKDMHVETRGRYRSILDVFSRLTRKGVDVRLLHAAVPSERYLHSLKDAGLIGAANFTMRRCVRVHFKCAVVDHDWTFIGSPNLTGAGMGAKSPSRRNFELGLLTRDAKLRESVVELYAQIWEACLCDDCDRKRACPVPLEEPDF